MQTTKPRILLLGHSFIHRLESAFYTGYPAIKMDLDSFRVRFHGRGGASILNTLNYDVRPRRSVVKTFRPQVVVLQVGGNDLCSHEASVIRQHLMSLVYELMGLSYVQQVVVLHVFPRRKPRYISAETYEDRREEINSFVDARLSMTDMRSCTLSWKHKRLEESPQAIFHSDGVHLNREIGIPKYWKRIRGAILYASKRLA